MAREAAAATAPAAAAGGAGGGGGSGRAAAANPGMEAFWELASVHASDRAAAVRVLAAATPSLVDSTYTRRRLCRGLGSGRGGARQGFAAALAHLVADRAGSDSDWTPAAVLDEMDSALEISGGMKGPEVRDALIGRVFGFAALARAHAAGAAMGADAWAPRCVAGLVECYHAKAFLREAAVDALLAVAGALDDAELARHVCAHEGFAALLCAPAEELSAEALLLVVRLRARLPAELRARVEVLSRDADGGACASSDDALFGSAAAVARLVPALRDGTRAHPRLHSVWGALREALLPDGGDDESAATEARLCTFWRAAVDKGLCESSGERRYAALSLAVAWMPAVPPRALLRTALSRDVLATVVAGIGSGKKGKGEGDNLLTKAAKECLSSIVAFASSAEGRARGVGASLALGLLQHADAGAKLLVRGSAVATLVDELDEDGVAQYVDQLEADFLTPSVDAAADADEDETGVQGAETAEARANAAAHEHRSWALTQMCGTHRLPQLPRSARAALRARSARFLATHAFFVAKPSAKGDKTPSKRSRGAAKKTAAVATPALVDTTRALAAARLMSLLADSLKERPEAGADGAGSEGRDAPVAMSTATLDAVCAHVDECEASREWELAAEISEGVATARATLAAAPGAMALEAPAGAGAGEGATRAAARALMSALRLSLLAPDAEHADASEDLVSALTKLFPAPTKAKKTPAKKSKKAASADAAEEEPEPMDVLVDVVLAVEASPSPLLRPLAETLFRGTCARVSQTGLADIVRVVTTESNTATAAGDDDGVLVEGDSDDEGSDEDDYDDDMESDEESDEGGDGAGVFGVAGGAAARSRGSVGAQSSDDESDGSGSGSESESEEDGMDMDDAAMFRTDKALSAHLSLVRERARARREATQALEHFRSRACGLLEACAGRRPCPAHAFVDVVPQLLALVSKAVVTSKGAATDASRGSQAQLTALGSRVAGLLKRLSSADVARGEAGEAAALGDAAAAALAKVLSRSRKQSKAPPAAMAGACGGAAQFLLRCVSHAEGDACVGVATRALSDATAQCLDRRGGRTLGRVLRACAARSHAAARAVCEAAAPRVGGGSAARSEFARVEAAQLALAGARNLCVAGDASAKASREAVKAACAAADAPLAALARDREGFNNARHRAQALAEARTLAAALLRAGGTLPALAAAAPDALAEAQDEANELSGKVRQALRLLARTASGEDGKRKGNGKPAEVSESPKKRRKRASKA